MENGDRSTMSLCKVREVTKIEERTGIGGRKQIQNDGKAKIVKPEGRSRREKGGRKERGKCGAMDKG